MKKFASKAGFTLVELIVVIAILGILAAVAVPTYSGYIAKAKQAGDLQVLSTINTAAQGLAAKEGKTVKTIVVTAAGAPTVTLSDDSTIASTDTDMKLLITGATDGSYTALTSGAYASGATYAKNATTNEWEWKPTT